MDQIYSHNIIIILCEYNHIKLQYHTLTTSMIEYINSLTMTMSRIGNEF